MGKVRAAVLAAGRGVRMGGKRPKTLLPLGDEQPLLHYILSGLKRSGIEDLLVVTGFGASEVQEYVGANWEGDATFVFNARWASWGNFHTVRMALEQSPGYDLLVVNCDVIVHPDVYKRVSEGEGDLVLAVQRRTRLDDEDMKVRVYGEVVRDIGKGMKRSLGHGEYAGVSLIRPEAAGAYMEEATTREWRADTAGYYEDVYKAILKEIDTRAVFIREEEYAEVDEPSDVESAIGIVSRHRDAWPSSPTAAGVQ